MIAYSDVLDGVAADQLEGFFVGWPKHPSPERHLEILQNSDYIVIARDTASGHVIGFINAVSDRILSAYIPLLEVLPEYQGRGIGAELVRRMLDQLSHLYMVDLTCDEDVQPFYERLGLQRYSAMMLRRFERQEG